MIEAIKLTKRFLHGDDPDSPAVQDVSFTIQRGEIFALLGANGAGKTTTLRMLATLLEPSSGIAYIHGYHLIKNSDQVRRHIGFITGETKLYDRFTPRELFFLFGRLYNMSLDQIKKRTVSIADTFEIHKFLDKRIHQLSDGMKQKVSLGRAVIHDPDCLILDEPLTGLDIFARRAVINFILKLKLQNKSVIFSTHVMSEADALCDTLAFMNGGQIVEKGEIKSIKKKYTSNHLESIFHRVVTNE